MSHLRSFLTILSVTLIMTAASRAEPVVLFDQGHGERFLPSEQAPLGLSGLADELRTQGITITALKEPISDTVLTGVSGIIISGPFTTFSQPEMDALLRYVEQGGNVAIMLHIAPPAAPLLHRLGVASTNGVIREQQGIIDNQPLNFSVVPDTNTPLMSDLTSFSVYGAWGLMPVAPHTRIAAATSAKAWIDRDGDKKQTERDATQSFAVAVTGTIGKGKFVVFGDDAIFQNQFLKGGNRLLATSLGQWITH